MRFWTWWIGRVTELQGWSRRGVYFFIWVMSVLLAIGFLRLAKWLDLSTKVDDHIRWLACAFEFFGVMLVIVGVDKSRRAFGRSSIFGTAVTWLKDARYLVVRRPPTTTTLLASGGSFRISMGNVRVVAHGSSVDERLEWLKKQISEVNDRVDGAISKMDEQEARTRSDLKAEETAREGADKELMKRLEESMIGDFGVELLGAGYLIVGLFLSNLTQEAANLAHMYWAR